MNRLTTLAASAAFLSLPFVATAATYELDPAHTWVQFSINHAGWALASGQFRDASGTMEFDVANAAAASLSVTIDAASIDTNDLARDDHLRSADFFNTAAFPTLTFTATGIEVTGEKTGKITGDLTMIGVTKSVTLDVTFNAEAPLPWDATVIKAGFNATGTISPADWGMTKVAEFGLGPDVAITINTEAVKK